MDQHLLEVSSHAQIGDFPSTNSRHARSCPFRCAVTHSTCSPVTYWSINSSRG